MSGVTFIHTLQILLGCAWLVPFIRKWPAVKRLARGRAGGDDQVRACIWFLSVAMLAGTIRWLVFPSSVNLMPEREIFAWSGVYAISIAAALSISWAFWEREHGR